MARLTENVHTSWSQQRHAPRAALHTQTVTCWWPHCLGGQGLPDNNDYSEEDNDDDTNDIDDNDDVDIDDTDDDITHLTLTPAGDVRTTLSDPIIVSSELLEKMILLLGSLIWSFPVTLKPCSSKIMMRIWRWRWLLPRSRSVRMFLFLLLMLTEKFPSETNLRGEPDNDDILTQTCNSVSYVSQQQLSRYIKLGVLLLLLFWFSALKS